MTVFVRVADTGSLSRAARELKLSQPSVSRIVGGLEARLGTTLLLRTTRSISLTDAGGLYLEQAKRLLAEVEEAEQATRGLDLTPRDDPPRDAADVWHPCNHTGPQTNPGPTSRLEGRARHE
ncbi:LysR family transcriptional regulator [Rhizobium tarimense]|nr:LysR family transcriptional regulator [Pseudorhizobium tarimense]